MHPGAVPSLLWDAGEQDLGSEAEGKLELLSDKLKSKNEKHMTLFLPWPFFFQSFVCKQDLPSSLVTQEEAKNWQYNSCIEKEKNVVTAL